MMPGPRSALLIFGFRTILGFTPSHRLLSKRFQGSNGVWQSSRAIEQRSSFAVMDDASSNIEEGSGDYVIDLLLQRAIQTQLYYLNDLRDGKSPSGACNLCAL